MPKISTKLHLVAKIECSKVDFVIWRLIFLDRKILKTAYIAFLELGTPNRLQSGSEIVFYTYNMFLFN